ncbi:MAG: hydrogenase maturation nickel metallochaperone HypA [Desulfovermiculus sp.]
MHELSLVQSLLDIVRQELRAHKLTRLKAVKVTCGRLSGAVPDALHMAFTALTRDTDLDGSCLELEIISVKLQCGQFGQLHGPRGPRTVGSGGSGYPVC